MKNKNDLVSVIVPVFNVDKYIEKTIETLLNQTYLNIEILLIDDGSTDNSGKICDIYAEKCNKIKVFHQNNNGVSSARNLGINNARGVYIIFVDGDDYVNPKYINTLYNDIIENNVDMAVQMYFNYYNEKKIVRNIENDINKNMTGIEFVDFQILGGKDTTVYAKIYRKQILDRYNIRFNESITNLEDMLFLYYYSIYCDKINYSSISNYYRIVRDTGVAFSRFNEKKIDALKVFDIINNELLRINNKNFIKKNLLNKFNMILIFCSSIIWEKYENKQLLKSLFLQAENILVLLNGKITIKLKFKYYLLKYLPKIYIFLKYIKIN